MSDILSPERYLDVLTAFQDTGNKIAIQLSEKLQRLNAIVRFCEGGIRGEEVQIVVGFDEFDESRRNQTDEANQRDETNRRLVIIAVLEAALELSLEWFISTDINRNKHDEL